jgi:HlyD family secretion protein
MVKSRRVVTLLSIVVPLALLAGVLWRLADAGESDMGVAGSAADSLRDLLGTSATEAFPIEMALPVEGAVVQRDTFVLWVGAQGRAAPLRSAPLVAEVAGPLVSVPVREGARVSQGQLLAQIDPSEYQLRVRRAEADLAFAQSEFEGLILGDDRLEDEELRAKRERIARLRSGLPGAETALEEAHYELERTEIRAPFAGRAADLVVDEGARLQVGEPVVQVVDLSRIDVEVQVLERALPSIEPGRHASIRFAALPDETFQGRVVTVNPIVSQETGTARVTVRLQNPDAVVLPGMFAEVEVAGRRFADRTFVPREAIVERDRRDVVFLLVPEEPGGDTGLAKWVYVRTGLENDEYVEVTPERDRDRLVAGDVVLVDGHTTLTHDARVRLENAAQIDGNGDERTP